MPIYDEKLLHTVRISNEPMLVGAIPDLIADSGGFLDYYGTAIDGLLIPTFPDRNLIIDTPAQTGIAVTNAVQLPDYHNQKLFQITPASEINPVKPEKLSFGDFDYPTYAAPYNLSVTGDIYSMFEVHYIVPNTSPKQFIVKTRANVTAAQLIGSNIYRIHQYATTAELGLLTLNLGLTSGAKVRAAIIATRDPSSGDNFPTRLANNEVMWSKFYPLGSQVTVDFSGWGITTNGYLPPSFPLADNTAGEVRFMLCLFWESGVPANFTLDAELTYFKKTTYESNV